MQDSTVEHVHTWEAYSIGIHGDGPTYRACSECGEHDTPVPPRAVQLVPEVIAAIHAAFVGGTT